MVVFLFCTLLEVSCSAMIRCTSLSKLGIGPNAAVDSFWPRPARPFPPRGLRTCQCQDAGNGNESMVRCGRFGHLRRFKGWRSNVTSHLYQHLVVHLPNMEMVMGKKMSTDEKPTWRGSSLSSFVPGKGSDASVALTW